MFLIFPILPDSNKHLHLINSWSIDTYNRSCTGKPRVDVYIYALKRMRTAITHPGRLAYARNDVEEKHKLMLW